MEYSDEAIDVPLEALTGREMYVTLTDEQKRFVDRVMTKLRIFFSGNAAANHRGRMPLTGDCLFLNGPGGSGKSYTYRVLFHLIRGAGFKVLMMASTGAAATLLPQGTTAHHAAALPVPLRSNSKANPRGLKLRKLSEAHVIIWDEAPMSVRYAFEAFDERLREIHQTTAAFGGTIVVLGGDFRQCLPVEEHSLTSEQLNLSIKRSRLWANFTVFDLTTNLRLQPGLEWFAKWQLSVGEGRNLGGPEGQESLPAEIISNGDLISEVYGEVLNAANVPAQRTLAEYLGSRCILAVLNEVCTWYNNAIVERLPGPAKVYASTDEIIADSSTDSHRHPVEFLHTIDVAGLPPHKLRVKRNTVVMLLRNLQVTEGLCNGTRMLVLDAKPNVLLVRILNGSHAGRIREIPRITLIYEGRHFPFKFTRHQFPVRLAFAMTVNKSQGQSSNRVLSGCICLLFRANIQFCWGRSKA